MPIKSRVAILTAVALTLSACGPKSADDPKDGATSLSLAKELATLKAIPIDQSTPDRALKTLWAIQDQKGRVACAVFQALKAKAGSEEGRAIFETVSGNNVKLDLFTGEARAYFEKRRAREPLCDGSEGQYRRQINEFKNETESRTVADVRIWNVSPIPKDVEKTYEFMTTQREKGLHYRYLMTKVGDKWLVEQIYSAYSDDTEPTPDLLWDGENYPYSVSGY